MSNAARQVQRLDELDLRDSQLQDFRLVTLAPEKECGRHGDGKLVRVVVADHRQVMSLIDPELTDCERGEAGKSLRPALTAAIQQLLPALAHKIGSAFAEALHYALGSGK